MKPIRTRIDPVTGEIYEIVREEVGDSFTLEQLEKLGVAKRGTCKKLSEKEQKNEDKRD